MEFEVCNAQTGKCIVTVAYEGPYIQDADVQAAGAGKVKLFRLPKYTDAQKSLYGNFFKFEHTHRKKIIGWFVEKINDEICRVEIDLERR